MDGSYSVNVYRVLAVCFGDAIYSALCDGKQAELLFLRIKMIAMLKALNVNIEIKHFAIWLFFP